MNPHSSKLPGPSEVLPLVRTLARCPDPVDLFSRLRGEGPAILLESADPEARQGDKSLLLASAALAVRCRDGVGEVEQLGPNGAGLAALLAGRARKRFSLPLSGSEEQRLKAESPLDLVRCLLSQLRLVQGDASMGPILAGSFSYDLLELFESLPPYKHGPSSWPQFEFFLSDLLIEIHHLQRTCTIKAHVYGGAHAEVAYHDQLERLGRVVSLIESLPDSERQFGVAEMPCAARADLSCDLDDEAFAACVARLQGHIKAGDVFQIVPSRTFQAPCPDPLASYRRLRSLNPSPYMFFLDAPGGVLFGASPECAVKVAGTPRRVSIRPIAGTRPRGRGPNGVVDADLDNRLEAELRLDEKELAEHMMLVDLARNDVARVSKTGSRRVDRLLSVERYSHVMHLVSSVSGLLREDLDALAAYLASMNMGTLTGAPKIKAAQLLRSAEGSARGPYGGAVGYLTLDGQMDTAIVIRSALVQNGVAQVRAGAGVVADSDPMAEAQETRRKAEAVLQVLPGGGVGQS